MSKSTIDFTLVGSADGGGVVVEAIEEEELAELEMLMTFCLPKYVGRGERR